MMAIGGEMPVRAVTAKITQRRSQTAHTRRLVNTHESLIGLAFACRQKCGLTRLGQVAENFQYVVPWYHNLTAERDIVFNFNILGQCIYTYFYENKKNQDK